MSNARFLRADGTPAPVYLLAGEDAGLVAQQLSALTEELAALEATPGAIEEYGESNRDEELATSAILDACRTPPFLSSRRIIVVRDTNGLDAAAQKEIAAYLADPLDTTVLVLALLGKRAPAALQKAVAATGVVLAVEPASGQRARQQWFAERLQSAPVRLEPQALALLDQHLGGDLARLEGLLEALESAYGHHSRISTEQLTPFLGEAGDSTPWELTDALGEGDGPRAIEAAHRQLRAGRHPLQLLATLQRHYGALLRLDGSGITDEKDAASATGLSPFPAKKALEASRRLGHERVTRAVSLVAAADLDLRGRVAWPGELVIEVLLARLAQLHRQRGARSPSAGRSSR